jgi:mono/diheme cytochrome c family protein
VIREELRAVLGTGGQAAKSPSAVTAPKAAPTPAGGRQAVTGPAVADDVTPPELQQQVLAAFQGQASCLTCHGPGKAAGGLTLAVETPAGLTLAKIGSDKRWKTYGMASVGAMPPAAVNDATQGDGGPPTSRPCSSGPPRPGTERTQRRHPCDC